MRLKNIVSKAAPLTTLTLFFLFIQGNSLGLNSEEKSQIAIQQGCVSTISTLPLAPPNLAQSVIPLPSTHNRHQRSVYSTHPILPKKETTIISRGFWSSWASSVNDEFHGNPKFKYQPPKPEPQPKPSSPPRPPPPPPPEPEPEVEPEFRLEAAFSQESWNRTYNDLFGHCSRLLQPKLPLELQGSESPSPQDFRKSLDQNMYEQCYNIPHKDPTPEEVEAARIEEEQGIARFEQEELRDWLEGGEEFAPENEVPSPKPIYPGITIPAFEPPLPPPPRYAPKILDGDEYDNYWDNKYGHPPKEVESALVSATPVHAGSPSPPTPFRKPPDSPLGLQTPPDDTSSEAKTESSNDFDHPSSDVQFPDLNEAIDYLKEVKSEGKSALENTRKFIQGANHLSRGILSILDLGREVDITQAAKAIFSEWQMLFHAFMKGLLPMPGSHELHDCLR